MTSWNPGDSGGQQQPGNSPGYGQQPPSYGQQPPQYGQSSGAQPGQSSPSFDKTPPPPPSYGQQPPQYGQQSPQYGQQAPQYGQQQSPQPYGGGYGAPNPYGGGGAVGAPGATPVSMGNRVVAFIIDGVILNLIGFIATMILFFGILGSASTLDCSSYTVDPNTGAISGGCENTGGAGAGLVITVLIMFAIFIAALVYYVMTLGKTGQTPGKKIMGVKVVDNDTGQPIGPGKAFLRYLVQYVSNIACYAGLWSAWLDGPPTGKYRAWHDKAVNSVVVNVQK